MSALFETFESRMHLAADISPVTVKLSRTGSLFINGTSARDNIRVTQAGSGHFAITVNGLAPTFLDDYGRVNNGKQIDQALVKRLTVSGGGNKDVIDVNVTKRIPALLQGNAGNDTIKTTTRNSTLVGGSGDDQLYSLGASPYRIVTFNSDDKGIYISSDGASQVVTSLADMRLTYNGTATPIRDAGATISQINNGTIQFDGTNYSIASDGTFQFRPSLVSNTRFVIDAVANRLEGNGGDDRFYTSGAEDSVFGGGGNDVVVRQANFDVFNGGAFPALPDNDTNDAPSRLAASDIDSIISEPSTVTIANTFIVRRNTIKA